MGRRDDVISGYINILDSAMESMLEPDSSEVNLFVSTVNNNKISGRASTIVITPGSLTVNYSSKEESVTYDMATNVVSDDIRNTLFHTLREYAKNKIRARICRTNLAVSEIKVITERVLYLIDYKDFSAGQETSEVTLKRRLLYDFDGEYSHYIHSKCVNKNTYLDWVRLNCWQAQYSQISTETVTLTLGFAGYREGFHEEIVNDATRIASMKCKLQGKEFTYSNDAVRVYGLNTYNKYEFIKDCQITGMLGNTTLMTLSSYNTSPAVITSNKGTILRLGNLMKEHNDYNKYSNFIENSKKGITIISRGTVNDILGLYYNKVDSNNKTYLGFKCLSMDKESAMRGLNYTNIILSDLKLYGGAEESNKMTDILSIAKDCDFLITDCEYLDKENSKLNREQVSELANYTKVFIIDDINSSRDIKLKFNSWLNKINNVIDLERNLGLILNSDYRKCINEDLDIPLNIYGNEELARVGIRPLNLFISANRSNKFNHTINLRCKTIPLKIGNSDNFVSCPLDRDYLKRLLMDLGADDIYDFVKTGELTTTVSFSYKLPDEVQKIENVTLRVNAYNEEYLIFDRIPTTENRIGEAIPTIQGITLITGESQQGKQELAIRHINSMGKNTRIVILNPTYDVVTNTFEIELRENLLIERSQDPAKLKRLLATRPEVLVVYKPELWDIDIMELMLAYYNPRQNALVVTSYNPVQAIEKYFFNNKPAMGYIYKFVNTAEVINVRKEVEIFNEEINRDLIQTALSTEAPTHKTRSSTVLNNALGLERNSMSEDTVISFSFFKENFKANCTMANNSIIQQVHDRVSESERHALENRLYTSTYWRD